MSPTTPQEMLDLLDRLYQQALDGIPGVSLPVHRLAEQYMQRHRPVRTAAKVFTRYQIAKCTASGFLSGLGGFLTLPVAIPANIGSVLYVQLRTIAALACMGGYDPHDNEVRTLVYACLANVSVDQLVKHLGIRAGTKLSLAVVKKIPAAALTKITQKAGAHFLTKLGAKGILHAGKIVPVVGGLVSGSFDFADTHRMAKRAYALFIKGDVFVLGAEDYRSADVEDDLQ
jgi:hypothetical protein